jgi:hypothetical protein
LAPTAAFVTAPQDDTTAAMKKSDDANGRARRRLLAMSAAAMLAGCASDGGPTGPLRTPGSLGAFQPARQAVMYGGQCVDSTTSEDGSLRLVAHFPDRFRPETAVAVFLDGSGRMVRYIETRGIPAPGDPERVMAELREIVQTLIQLDYITGEASARNRNDGTGGRIVGTVRQLENTKTLGNLPARADRARAVCTA